MTEALRQIDNLIASDVAVTNSDLASAKSDLIVAESDLLSIASDLVVTDSDLIVVSSDLTATRSDIFNAIADSITAFGAMDTANVSDLVIGIGEILSAFSDALPYN